MKTKLFRCIKARQRRANRCGALFLTIFLFSFLFFFFAGSVFAQPGGLKIKNMVSVSARSQAVGGIKTATLKSSVRMVYIEAYGTALQPGGLLKDRMNYVSALAASQKAHAELAASKKEYYRLKTLNKNGKNVSDRAVEAAAAAFAMDVADEGQADSRLAETKEKILFEWGGTISGWIFTSSPGYQSLLRARDVLVRVTVPPSEVLHGIPLKIRLRSPSGVMAQARFLARAKSTDPHIQGISFIYMAPALPAGLLPGMNVTARLPSGGAGTGFFIPLSSVVWLDGKAWVYIRKTGTGFSRVQVPVETPVVSSSVRGGYFVIGTFENGQQIVVRGAQALLSTEMMPKGKKQKGGDDGDDD